MGNIADQFPVLFFMLKLFIQRFFQPQSHILVVAVKFTDFTLFLRSQHIFQIALGDILHRCIQLVDRGKNSSLYSLGQEYACKNKNQDKGKHHPVECLSGKQGIYAGNNEKTSLAAVWKAEIHFFHKLFDIAVVIARLWTRHFIAVFRQCRKYFPGGTAVAGIINLVVFSHYDIGGFIFQIKRHLIQIIHILQPGRIFLDLLSYFLQHFLRNAAVIFYRVYIGSVIAVKKPVRRFCILYMAAHHQKRNACEQKRQQHHRQWCDQKPCSEFHLKTFFLRSAYTCMVHNSCGECRILGILLSETELRSNSWKPSAKQPLLWAVRTSFHSMIPQFTKLKIKHLR